MLIPLVFTGCAGCWTRRLFRAEISRYSLTLLLFLVLISLCNQAMAIAGPSAFTCEPYWDYRIVCHVSGTGDPNTGGNLIVRSSSPISWQPASGHFYPVDYGTRLADDVFLINNARNIWDVADENLEAGRTYFYRAWIYDYDTNYSATSAACQCVPTGESSLIESCTQITARAGDLRILLKWQNPTVGDYSETIVVRSAHYIKDWRPVNGHVYTVGEDVSPTIRVVALGSDLQFFLDRDVTNDTTYYYRIYAATSAEGYSWGAPIEAVPTSRSVAAHYRLKVSWGQPGTGPGAFHAGYGPAGICLVPSQDAILVADYGNRRIQSFSRDGDLKAEHWEQEWFDNSPEEYQILDVEFLPNGRIAGAVFGDRVIASYTHVNADKGYGIGSYDLSGYFIHENTNFEDYHLPSYSSLAHSIHRELSSWSDNVLMSVNRENQLLEFNEEATFLRSWGTAGQNPGQISGPLSVVQGLDGYVYVGDETGRIQRFTVGGTYVSRVQWLPEGEMAWDMAKDRYGNFYVLSSGYKVYKFDLDWRFLLGFDIQSPGGWAYPRIGRLCVDSDECVYVADATACQVKVFAPTDSNGPTVTYNSYAAEPVNTRTGRYVYEHTDREADDIGLPFRFTRVYNSGDSYFDVLGAGWRHNYDIRVSQPRTNALVVHWGDGHDVTYEDWGDGYKPVLPGTYETLTKEEDNTYRLTTKEQTVYAFNTQGRLVSIADKNANVTSLTYDDTFNRLITIMSPSGRMYQLSYHPSGLLGGLLDPLVRQVTCGYDADGNLSQVTDAEGHTTHYEYDANGWLTKVIDGRGNAVVQNVYVAPVAGSVVPNVGKVTSQKNALENETTFVYAGDRTTMTDPLANQTTYDYDGLGRMVKQTDPDGLFTSFEYDADNNRTKVTDHNGNVTRYEYDVRGNMTKKTDAAGNTVVITYNDQNQPSTKTDESGNTTQFEYDEHGNLIKTTDALGKQWTRTYDENGQPLTETDPLGGVISYEYDTQGNLTQTNDRNGNVTAYTYDAAGRRLTQANALNQTTVYVYDGNDKLVLTTDALGRTTQYEYDASGNRTRIVCPDASQKTFAYDANDQMISETDELGRVTAYEYDANGRKTRTTDANAGTTVYAYDAMGNLISETDANGQMRQYQYDGNGNRTRAEDPLGFATAYVFDGLNRNTGITDALGFTTTMAYDAMGRLLSQTAPDGGVTQHAYDVLGRKTSDTDSLGHTTLHRYDDAGRLTEVENALGQVAAYEYDANGNRTRVKDPLNHSTQYQYDALNRQTHAIDALGNTSVTQYDAGGRKTGVMDALGRSTAFGCDARDRLVSVTDAAGGVTHYGYDAAGNMLSFTNARGKTWSYAYDDLNRRISETTPLGHTDLYAYDAVGNRTSHQGPDAQTTVYAYDAANRLLTVSYPDGLHVQYAYDALGRRTSMVDGVGTTSYTYDAMGRIVLTTDPFDKMAGYAYDAAGNKTAITYPDSTQVAYVYDALNRMQTVTDWASNTTAYQYDAAGRLIQETAPNGIVTTYQYDTADRLTHKRIVKPGGEVVAEYGLALDAVGNRTNIDINQPLMPPAPSAEDTASEYDADNRILHAGSTTYQFDPRGRMTAKTTAQGPTNYTFDYRDRLAQVAAPDRTDQYRYDGNGNRLESTYGPETTRYVLDLTQNMTWVLCDTDAGGAITSKYVYGLGLVAASRGGGMSYYHFDQLGSTVAVTDSSMFVANSYAYDEFGRTAASVGSLPSPFEYVGKLGVMQENNGLLYMRARFYESAAGRFVTVDPVAGTPALPLSLNVYPYGVNNPILLDDASGEVIPLVVFGAVWLASAYFGWDFAIHNAAPQTGGLPATAQYVGGGAIISAAKGLSFSTPVGGAFTTASEAFDKAQEFTGDKRWETASRVADNAGLCYGMISGLEGVWFKGHATRGIMQYATESGRYMSDSEFAARMIKGAGETIFEEAADRLGQQLVKSSHGELGSGMGIVGNSQGWQLWEIEAMREGILQPQTSRQTFTPTRRSPTGEHRYPLTGNVSTPPSLIGGPLNEPIIYERYEPKYRLINKTQLKDME